MSDTPRDAGADDPVPGSAPWERPRRWTPPTTDATKVDDLLARLGTDDTGQRRSRRREAGTGGVEAGALIAALQASGTDKAGAVEDEPTVAVAGPAPAAGADPGSGADPGTGADPGSGADAGTGADAGIEAAGGAEGSEAEPAVLSGDDPTIAVAASAIAPSAVVSTSHYADADADSSATVLIPRYTESAAAIRESLRQQAEGPPPSVPPVPDRPTGAGDHPHHGAARGFLYAGRSVIALLAVVLMAFTGFEYSLLQTTDQALKDRRVAALDPNDTHIKTPSKSAGATNAPGSAGGTATAAPGQVAPAKLYPPENILLLGSDTRQGANGNSANMDATTGDTAQSDTLMIAHISADRQHITIVSVPRDLRVEAPQCKAWDAATSKVSDQDFPISAGETWKITNAYAVGGAACTVKAVQQLTGLRIDRVIGVDFVGFKTMVDALGGIKVNICKPIIDAELSTVVPTAGQQTIRGDQALNLVRARKVYGDPTGDIGRIHRQQVVLSALLRQAVSAGTLLDPAKLKAFLEAFTKSTYTDNIDVDSMLQLATSLGDLNPEKVTFYTLPTVPSADGDSEELDPKAAAVFEALLNDQPLPGEPTVTTKASTTKATASAASSSKKSPSTKATTSRTTAAQKLTVSPADVDLEVVNVSGRTGVAGDAMGPLNALGFQITEDDLTLPADEPVYEPVTVLYAPANRAAALTVAAAVPGSVLETQADLGTKVRLLLGSSYDGTLAPVSVGETVPPSLQSTAAEVEGTSSAGTTAETSAPSTPSTGTATKTGPTLKATDLSSVNAAQALCA